MNRAVSYSTYLVVVAFLLILSCGRRSDLKGSASDTSYLPATSAICLNLPLILDTIRGRVFKVYPDDSTLYKEIENSEPPHLYALNEKRLPDGYILFFKSKTDRNPTIIEHVTKRKKNGLFVYFDSSNLYFQLKYCKNDEVDGLYFSYVAPCIAEFKGNYDNGKQKIPFGLIQKPARSFFIACLIHLVC